MESESKHTCPTCLQTTGKDGHLCMPEKATDEKCDWCGSLIPDKRHLCNKKVKEISYVCNSCGRSAVNPEYLCKPQKIT